MMKKLTVLLLTVFIVSCDSTPYDEDEGKFRVETCKFMFVNKSNVEVAVVMEHFDQMADYEIDFPDSMVLKPENEYCWEMQIYASHFTKFSPVIHPNPPLGSVQQIKIYFDKKTLVTYNPPYYPTMDRDPSVWSNYIESEPTDTKYKKVWTYTFTPEDYQRALEQNKTEK